MTKRGYIKEVPGNAMVSGNHMRMRFVQAGYNADSESVPPNKVIFDSDDLGTLSLLTSGDFRFLRDGANPVTRTVATWSDLGYVPLVTFQFRGFGITTWNPVFTPGGFGASIPPQRIIVDRTGITATMLTFTPEYVDIRYQVYRLPVV